MQTQLKLIRQALPKDAKSVQGLITPHAESQVLLPRSLQDITARIREFLVVDDPRAGIVGCVALRIFSEDLAEIRSLAVDKNHQQYGYGKMLIVQGIQEAVRLEIKQVFALTLVTGFFEKLGFTQVGKETLPLKVCADCVACPKFYHCDEVALTFDCKLVTPHSFHSLAKEERTELV